MDPAVYKAGISGSVNVLMVNKSKLLDEVTQNNNTVLHLASQFGHADCVVEILKMAPSLLDKPNSRNETALHLSARNGHRSVCEKLIDSARKVMRDIESGDGAVKEMMWKQNKEKDTALHLAARQNFHLVVRLLTKEDPHHPHPANDSGESPLYMAASRGHSLVVDEILNNCESPAYNGPQGSTALHGAVISHSIGCVQKLLGWDSRLTRKTDVAGQTPLHYSAILGYTKIVTELMIVDRSCAYIQDGDGKNNACHLAASHGGTEVIEKMVSYCPDLWDMVNGEKQHNILHIAVEHGHKDTAKFILYSCPDLSGVINQKDVDGNTPFHMIATCLCDVEELIYHPLIDKRPLNNKNLTPLDLVTSAHYPPETAVRQREVVRDLKQSGATRSLLTNNQDCEITMPGSGGYKAKQMDGGDILRGKSNDYVEKLAILRRMGETHMIVGALVATVTFAAGFTMPGGYNGKDEGLDLGLAILRNNKAFKVFVVADTLALAISVTAISLLFKSTTKSDLKEVEFFITIAASCIKISILAMVTAFITGTYASLAPSKLAIATCVVGSILSYYIFGFLIVLGFDPWKVFPKVTSYVASLFRDFKILGIGCSGSSGRSGSFGRSRFIEYKLYFFRRCNLHVQI